MAIDVPINYHKRPSEVIADLAKRQVYFRRGPRDWSSVTSDMIEPHDYMVAIVTYLDYVYEKIKKVTF